jgi:hypothetical protein
VVIWTTHVNQALADHKAYGASDRGRIFQLSLCSTFAWTLSLLSLDSTKYPEGSASWYFVPPRTVGAAVDTTCVVLVEINTQHCTNHYRK